MDIFVKGFFALQVLFFDMDVLRLTLGAFGKVEEVVAHTVHFDVFGKGDRDLLAFEIIGFQFCVIGFDLVEVGKNEVAVRFLLLFFLCQFLLVRKFCQQLREFFDLLGDGREFLLFHFLKTFLLHDMVAFFQNGIDVRRVLCPHGTFLIIFIIQGVVRRQHPTRNGQQFHPRTDYSEGTLRIDMPEGFDDHFIFVQKNGIGIFPGKFKLQADDLVFV